MVKIYLFFLFLFFLPLNAASNDVKVNAEVDMYGLYENTPINGTLQVTHDAENKVDTSMIFMEGKPLAVKLVKEMKFSPNSPITVSTFSFQISGRSKGLYALPVISVTVGGEIYKSISSTYQISASKPARPAASTPTPPASPPQSPPAPPAAHPQTPAAEKAPSAAESPAQVQQESPQPAPAPASSKQQPSTPASQSSTPVKPSLKLESIVDAKKPIYPGQRFKLTYRYLYKGDIELRTENLPFLTVSNFQKIGEKDIKEYSEGDTSVFQITQEMEAVRPGHFFIPGAKVDGAAYQTDSIGERHYDPNLLKAETSAVTIDVSAFPIGKPASFNGAVGQLTFSVKRQTPEKVNVGDQVILEIDVEGKTSDWLSLKPPELCCQPGFSGLFQVGDLPPSSKVTATGKVFKVNIRPLSAKIKKIPSIEFSYFDPNKSSYVTLHSDPLPLTVTASKQTTTSTSQTPLIKPKSNSLAEQKPVAIEIYGIFPLSDSSLDNKFFGSNWVFLLIPLVPLLLFFQFNWLKSREMFEKTEKKKSSPEWFNEALKAKPDTPEFYQALNESFLTRLLEKGKLTEPVNDLIELPTTGIEGRVREFLMDVEEKHFTGKGKESYAEILENAKKLYKELS